jgi:hypothetical protein
MNGLRILSAVLVFQVILAFWTWWPRDHAELVPHPLLELDPAAITAIEIARRPTSGEDEATAPSDLDWLRLERDGERWRIASADGYPADPAKVNQLVGRLLGMQVRSPIATTRPSHNALGVGEREYGRRVRIRADGFDRELVIGAARSNSVNVRFADEDAVYLASGLSEFSLADTPSSYWATDYVRVAPGDVRSFVVENDRGTVLAERSEEGWTLADAPEDARVDTDAIDELLGRVTTLPLVEPVGTEMLPEHGLEEGPRITWTLDAEDQTVTGGYRVGAVEGGNAFAKSDGDAFVVKVPASRVEPLRSFDREQLLEQAAPPETPEDS